MEKIHPHTNIFYLNCNICNNYSRVIGKIGNQFVQECCYAKCKECTNFLHYIARKNIYWDESDSRNEDNCVKCQTYLGEMNPRQLCGKWRCLND